MTRAAPHVPGVRQLDECPPDDLFGELQSEAYSIMLFELFPRFYEACKNAGEVGDAKQSKITESTTLKDVLKQQDFEIHLFAEYCREFLCEDQVIFLLEVNDYRLLFANQVPPHVHVHVHVLVHLRMYVCMCACAHVLWLTAPPLPTLCQPGQVRPGQKDLPGLPGRRVRGIYYPPHRHEPGYLFPCSACPPWRLPSCAGAHRLLQYGTREGEGSC